MSRSFATDFMSKHLNKVDNVIIGSLSTLSTLINTNDLNRCVELS